jgi:tetratricopeptide (TPR) repeat protein
MQACHAIVLLCVAAQAYKAKRFEEAIQHYNRALELYDKDISFLTNRCDLV